MAYGMVSVDGIFQVRTQDVGRQFGPLALQPDAPETRLNLSTLLVSIKKPENRRIDFFSPDYLVM